jgi:hypothetical protein
MGGGGVGVREQMRMRLLREILHFLWEDYYINWMRKGTEGDYTVRMPKESGSNCDEFAFLTVTSEPLSWSFFSPCSSYSLPGKE